MIASKNPQFPVEPNSYASAKPLVDDLWGIARALHCTAFQYHEGARVQDDHIPLNEAGIPAVDIIDFGYPYWHRLTDVPENCSPEGLEQVARVVTAWLQRVPG
jgi:glutaminyl-peptide cyclotransferase